MERVKAIRKDRYVGTGTGSDLDSYYEDEDLLELLIGHEIESPEEAILWAYSYEGIEVDSAKEEHHFIDWQELRMPLE